MTPSSAQTPGPTPPPTDPPTLPADPVEQAKAALASHLGVDQAQVTVVSSDEVTWRDGSLGCPQPDMMSTQALVPGWRLQLAAGGRSLDYHASEQGRVVYCAPGRAKAPLPDSKS